MLFCRQGILVGRKRWIVGFVFWSCLFTIQAPPVRAQDPSATELSEAPPESAGEIRLEFEPNQFDDVREGYVSLAWPDIAEAASYRVTDAQGDVVYAGEFAQAFVSGLPDGSHSFDVAALDADGQTIAQSTTPATVNVRHWPLWQALLAFGIGLVVFIILIGSIIRGAKT